MAAGGPRARDWLLTDFDYEREVVLGTGVRGVVWQVELCPTTQRRHLQMLVMFNNAVRLRTVQSYRPGAHAEPRRGTLGEAIQYCRKEQTRVAGPFTLGQVDDTGDDGAAKRPLSELLLSGDLGAIRRERPVFYLQNRQRIINFMREGVHRTEKTEVHWYWGAPGTGKSRFAWETYPDAYPKNAGHKWWDGYEGQDVIIIDDWSSETVMNLGGHQEVLNLFDRYKLIIQVKGEMTHFTSKKIIVTSNLSLDEVARGFRDPYALTRRVDVVREFTGDDLRVGSALSPILVDWPDE